MPETTPTGPTLSHLSYLGASDIGAVAGLNDYRNALDVWAEKRGIAPPFEGNIRTRIGNAFERPTLDIYQELRGSRVSFPGTIIHPAEKFAGATPDAISDENDGMVAEVKIVGRNSWSKWGPVEEGADGVPPEVYCQVHWQSWIAREVVGISGRVAHIVAVMGTDYSIYEVPISDEAIEDLILTGRDFWERCVVGGETPLVEGARAQEIIAALYPENKSTKLEPITDEVAALCRHFAGARSAEKIASDEKKKFQALICDLIGEGAGFEGTGIKVSWKNDAKGRPNWKAVADACKAIVDRDNPGAFERFVRDNTSEPGRRFTCNIKEG